MEHYNLTNGIVKLFLLHKQIVLVINNLWLYGVCREVVNEVPIKTRRMEIKNVDNRERNREYWNRHSKICDRV